LRAENQYLFIVIVKAIDNLSNNLSSTYNKIKKAHKNKDKGET